MQPSLRLNAEAPSVEFVPTDAGAIAPLLLTPRQAAALLAVSERTLWSLSHKRGEIPVLKIGAAARYRLKDLQDYCARQVSRPIPRAEAQ